MVPEEWSYKSLGDISSISSGGTPSRKVEKYWGGNIPWVTTAEINFNTIKDASEKITEEGLFNSSAKIYPINTILMAMYGQGKTRGKVAKLGINAATNQACAAIVLNSGHEVEFILQFLINHYAQIRELSNSGGQKNLSSTIVKGIVIPIPPLAEQKKIAKILSTWDKAISTTEQLLSNSQQQKKALMEQLLTGKKRFPGFTDEWKENYLYSISKIVMGSSPSSKAYNNKMIGLPLLQGNADISKRKSSPRNYTSQITKECSEGDILITVRAPVGHVALSIHHACIGRGIAAIKSNKKVFQEFLYQWLLWNENQWASFSQGSTFESINKNELEKLKINFPITLEEQQKIGSVLTSADKEIKNLQKQLESLKQEKKALMQQLLTGKRRVQIDKTEESYV